jgi:hypothetical protein
MKGDVQGDVQGDVPSPCDPLEARRNIKDVLSPFAPLEARGNIKKDVLSPFDPLEASGNLSFAWDFLLLRRGQKDVPPLFDFLLVRSQRHVPARFVLFLVTRDREIRGGERRTFCPPGRGGHRGTGRPPERPPERPPDALAKGQVQSCEPAGSWLLCEEGVPLVLTAPTHSLRDHLARDVSEHVRQDEWIDGAGEWETCVLLESLTVEHRVCEWLQPDHFGSLERLNVLFHRTKKETQKKKMPRTGSGTSS